LAQPVIGLLNCTSIACSPVGQASSGQSGGRVGAGGCLGWAGSSVLAGGFTALFEPLGDNPPLAR